MTAEIGIINQRGVALAADSAVTITKSNNEVITLNNAKKLFSLYNSNYIGIMIYQNANFMGVPWEVLINSFKENIGNQVRPHVEDYVNAFLKYINSLNIYTDASENQFVAENAFIVLNALSSEPQDIETIENELYMLEKEMKKELLLKINFEEFKQKYAELTENIFYQKYNPQCAELIPLFTKVVAETIASGIFTDSYTGVVIAGYGSNELFPSIYQLKIGGRFQGQIKYKCEVADNTDPINGNITSGIHPFAQREMVDTIVNGIDSDLYTKLTDEFNDILNKVNQYVDQEFEPSDQITDLKNYILKVVKRRYEEFEKITQNNYSNPIVSMLGNLSVKELAHMADTFVNLTSFKRKYSGSIRTVGGPVDVLVVSRENGPVWVNNKQRIKY